MAKAYENALYSPYGAYELKAKYQRNFGIGTLMALGLVVVIVGASWIISSLEGDLPTAAGAVVIQTVADLGPPPSVAQKPPQIKVQQPNVAAPKVGIPKPVADEEVLDEDVVIASKEELAEIVAPDISNSGSDQDIVVNIGEDEFLPPPDEFVPVEIYPEMIYQEQPEYPRLAKQAGITGVVWVKALVDKEGNVRDAIVGKSSGTASLDEAAVQAAFKNKFKPGVQNGHPVAVWVTYKVEFELNN